MNIHGKLNVVRIDVVVLGWDKSSVSTSGLYCWTDNIGKTE